MKKDIKRKLKKFTRFLKENNCYIQYFNNYNIEFAMLSFINLLGNSYYNLFYCAFYWGESKEGFEYWEKKHEEWLDNFSFL